MAMPGVRESIHARAGLSTHKADCSTTAEGLLQRLIDFYVALENLRQEF
jgi:hypothetical protein